MAGDFVVSTGFQEQGWPGLLFFGKRKSSAAGFSDRENDNSAIFDIDHLEFSIHNLAGPDNMLIIFELDDSFSDAVIPANTGNFKFKRRSWLRCFFLWHGFWLSFDYDGGNNFFGDKRPEWVFAGIFSLKCEVMAKPVDSRYFVAMAFFSHESGHGAKKYSCGNR
jgi:hypothetical protein